MGSSDDNLAFERLVRPHFERLYRLAWRLTGSQAEAEDLFQEVLVKAYGKLEQLAAVDQAGPWLARVMVNRFIDQRRRVSRQRLHIVDEAELGADGIASLPDMAASHDPAAAQQQIERRRALQRALDQLSGEHRLVVLLHDAEGYKLSEIQYLTDTPVGTVKSRLHRARARLRELLGNDGTFSLPPACKEAEAMKR